MRKTLASGRDMDITHEALKRVRKTIGAYHMINPGERIVVAVSGGADSVCLLDVLCALQKELEMELVVAHYDHGLRPGEDEAETRFVSSLAESFGLHFVTEKAADTLGSARNFSEDKARRFRYRFFYQVQKETSADKIALGHNLDDQAETVLMRLLRGSGPSGLGGIPPVREGRIIRPLIEMKRSEIENYLKSRNLKYVTDSSNRDKSHLRNRVRLELLPLLKDYQPKVIEILGNTADLLRQDEHWLGETARGWLAGNATLSREGEIVMEIAALQVLPTALKNRVIRSVIEEVGGSLHGVHLRHVDSISEIAQSGKAHARLDLPGSVAVRKTYDRLIFSANPVGNPKDLCFSIAGPGTYSLDEPESTLSVEELEGKGLEKYDPDPKVACLNGDALSFPLGVRRFRPGDRFVPLGMKGHKKIKDFFIDSKIPILERKRIPLLTHNDRPIWICGLRIDDRYRVTPKTRKVLKITWHHP